MQYRRAFVPGGSFFFTVVTANHKPLFTEQKNVVTLRGAFRNVRSERPFTLNAAVILPDHLHCIWTLPSGDADFATRWRLIKTWFTKHCDSELELKLVSDLPKSTNSVISFPSRDSPESMRKGCSIM